jgi:hypothetical protein
VDIEELIDSAVGRRFRGEAELLQEGQLALGLRSRRVGSDVSMH